MFQTRGRTLGLLGWVLSVLLGMGRAGEKPVGRSLAA